MNELQKVFDYSGVQVRTIIKDNEPWFVAKDVCDVLEYGNSSDVIKRLDEDDLDSTEVIDSVGRKQITNIVSEFGLYDLILRSRKEEAKQFKRWITHEVLPSIRKTGQYGTPEFLGKMHESMNKIRALGWRATPTERKKYMSGNITKIKDYYLSLIDSDVTNEPNPMEIFVQECCVINKNLVVDRSDIYISYMYWCERNNICYKSKMQLTNFLSELDDITYLRTDSQHFLRQRFAGIDLIDKEKVPHISESPLVKFLNFK